jgi:hypothetical protein
MPDHEDGAGEWGLVQQVVVCKSARKTVSPNP